MTGKKLFATIFVLVALVVWGATTPNVTVAADQLRTRDRLQDTTCLTTPIKDQTRDRLHTSTTTVVSSAQLQQTAAPTAAATATLPQQTRPRRSYRPGNSARRQDHACKLSPGSAGASLRQPGPIT